MRNIDEISGDGIDVALRLHHDLGPGLMESVYEALLAGRLMEMGYAVARPQPINIDLEGMRLTNQPVGLLTNFGGNTLKQGLQRLVNNHISASSAPLREPINLGD